MITNNYYKELGKLLYAVAKTSGATQSDKISEVKTLIKFELAQKNDDSDDFLTSPTLYTEFGFDVYRAMDVDTGDAYNSFITFINKHTADITPGMRKTALRLSRKVSGIANSSTTRDKELMDKLKKDMKLN